MLEQLEKTKAQWGGVNKVLDSWLKERQQVLVAYCELAGLQPFDSESKKLPAKKQIRSFCQILVDYISAGHFEVFDSIVAECATHGEKSAKLAQALYPKISQSTDVALAFNDKYADSKSRNMFESFDHDLTELGQQLEERFTFEDELLGVLHTYHS
ncbi:sigma D regulator [Thalassotalea fusca]